MIYNTTDSEYYRKSAGVLHALRYVVLLLLLLLFVVGFTVYKRELTIENFRYIMRYADFDMRVDYLSSNQISFSAGDDTHYGYIKGDIALLEDSYFASYDFTGTQLVFEKLSLLNSALKTADKYALVYDVGGTGLYIFNSYSCVYQDQFEYGISDAAIKSDGSFAVASSGKYLSSKITVYSPNGTEKFKWETRDKEVIALSLPEKDNALNFVTLSAASGDFVTTLFGFSLDSEEPRFQKEYIGEFPLKVHSTKDTVCLLTDKALHFVSVTGEEKVSYTHDEGQISGFFESGDFIALTYQKSVTKNSTLRLYTKSGEEITADDFEDNIIGFAAYGDNVYALEKGKLHIREINRESNLLEYKNVSEIEVDSHYTDVFAKSANEYILVSKKGAGKFS